MPRVCAGGRARTGSVGIKSPGPVPSGATSARSARLVSNEAFRCIRAASSPADSGPWMFWWTQGVSEARPPACRAGALPLSYVSVVVMGGFDPPPRAFQARALPTELHDHGAGPGTRTRITWVTKPVPIPLGPAGTSRAAMITPRHPGAVRSSASTTRSGRTDESDDAYSAQLRRVVGRAFTLSSGTTSFSRSCRIGAPPFQMVREEGVEPSSQGPKPCVLPLDDSRKWVMEGSMGTAPITRGWKPRVYLSTP